MYPRNAASPERIAVGAVVQISDGAVQGSAVTITVRGQGGAEGAGGGTTAYGATGVIVYYTPTQAETDFTSFVVIASKAGCIPVAQTIVTTASSVPGRTMPADGSVTAAVIAAAAIDAATFAADVDAEILSYIVDDATRIDASAANAISADWTNAGRLDAILDIIAADTTTDIPALIATAQTDLNSIEAAVITNAAGVDIAADIIAMKVDTAAILVDTGTTLDTKLNTIDDFLDTEIAAILALLDDARAEPGQGAPPVNPDLATKIDYLYKAWRNKKTQTSTTWSLYADDAATVDQKSTVSDDATTATRGEIATGP